MLAYVILFIAFFGMAFSPADDCWALATGNPAEVKRPVLCFANCSGRDVSGSPAVDTDSMDIP